MSIPLVWLHDLNAHTEAWAVPLKLHAETLALSRKLAFADVKLLLHCVLNLIGYVLPPSLLRCTLLQTNLGSRTGGRNGNLHDVGSTPSFSCSKNTMNVPVWNQMVVHQQTACTNMADGSILIILSPSLKYNILDHTEISEGGASVQVVRKFEAHVDV
jgi:hypothetical protein